MKMLEKLKNSKISQKVQNMNFRIRMSQGVPSNEIIIRSIPSDVDVISFMTQVLSSSKNLIIRYNFIDQRMSFVTFSQENTDHIMSQLENFAIDAERSNYIPTMHDSTVRLVRSPQFQYTKYNSIVSLEQEELDEKRAENIDRVFGIIIDQLSQSRYPVDLMIRTRKLCPEEISDVKTNLHKRFKVHKKNASSTFMGEVPGPIRNHRISMDVVNFDSVSELALLQNQAEDLLSSVIYAYELIVFSHEDALKEIEGILNNLPNSTYLKEYNQSVERAYDFVPTWKLHDGTYNVASATLLSEFLDFENGKLTHIKESVFCKIPPENVFESKPNSKTLDVTLGRIDKAKHKAILQAKNDHVLITGATNTGKTNSAMIMMVQLILKGAKMFIIEPTKGEWYNIGGFFDMHDHGVLNNDIDVICLGSPERGVGFLYNPFAVPDGVSVDSHIQRLDYAFSVAFGESMTEPQYGVLDNCIHILYETFENPCFSDLLEIIENYEDPNESAMVMKMLKGALKRKFSRFTHGSIGHCFDVNVGLGPDDLLNNNIVLNLAWLKDESMKNFIVASVLNTCVEYLEVNGSQTGQLKHIIGIEEAHRIFPNIPDFKLTSKEGASVKSIAEMLKEVRGYDTSVFLFDQSPGALFRDAVLNTAVKIAFRVADGQDKRTLQESMALSDEQAEIMPTLEVGRCYIHNPVVFPDPFMIRFDRADHMYMRMLREKGVQNPVPLDANVQNLAGRTITDKRIIEVAEAFYAARDITWEQFTGDSYAKTRKQNEKMKEIVRLQAEKRQKLQKKGLKDIDVDKLRESVEGLNVETSKEEEIVKLPAKNLDEVLKYMDYTHFNLDLPNKREVVAAVIRNHQAITCKSEFYCAATISSVLTKDFPEDIAPDVIGRIFLKLIDCKVLSHTVGENNQGFVCINPEFDVKTAGLSSDKVRWGDAGKNNEQTVEKSTEQEDVGVPEISEVIDGNEPVIEVKEVTEEDLEDKEEGVINSVQWIVGTHDEERKMFAYVDKYDDDLIEDLYKVYASALLDGNIDEIIVSGSTEVTDKIRDKIPLAMSNVQDMDYLTFLSSMKVKSVAN
jgi:hypothetical protein